MFRSALLSALLFLLSASAFPDSTREKVKQQYDANKVLLQAHIVDDWWIDDSREASTLLERQWRLAADWLAAWLDEHPASDCAAIQAVLLSLAPEEQRDCLRLNQETFVVSAPTALGNAFIMAREDGHFQRVWSSSQHQSASGHLAVVLAAWRADNAKHLRRGPYAISGGPQGSLMPPRLGLLPEDLTHDPRFYMVASYSQAAGVTMGEQTTVWAWKGNGAVPLAGRDYVMYVDQPAGVRLEGDLLKVRQKKFFKTFLDCGGCDGRQVDWVWRIRPDGIENVGEWTAVPEMEAVDDLIFRMQKGKPTSSLAADEVRKQIYGLVHGDTAKLSGGQLFGWRVDRNPGSQAEMLCVLSEGLGARLFTLLPRDGKFYISQVKPTQDDCSKK